MLEYQATKNATFFVLGLAGYQLLNYVCHLLINRTMPTFYTSLISKTSITTRRRSLAYFVFPVGMLLTAFTTPICLAALISKDAGTDMLPASLQQSLMPVEKICLGSRATMWISEWPLLSFSLDYSIHHALSLAGSAFAVYDGVPLRPLYVIYVGLVTEFFSDTTSILRYHGLDHTNSTFFRYTAIANILGMLLLRVVPVVFFVIPYLLSIPILDIHIINYIAVLIFYVGWLLRLSWKQANSLNLVKVVLERPCHIVININTAIVSGGKVSISLYSICLGIAITAAQLATATTYMAASQAVPSISQIRALACIGFAVVFGGLLGANLFNKLLQNDVEKNSNLLPQLPAARLTPFFPILNGISIQGGIFFSASLALVLSQYFYLSIIDTMLLMTCMGLSLPLGEAVGRIGCSFAGCCGGGRLNNSSTRVQPLSTVMNATIFVLSIFSIHRYDMDIFSIGWTAVALNAGVRLLLSRHRADESGALLSYTNLFASLQMAISVYQVPARYDLTYIVGVVLSLLIVDLLWMNLGPVIMSYVLTCTRRRIPWTFRPVIFVVIFSTLIAFMEIKGQELVFSRIWLRAIAEDNLVTSVLYIIRQRDIILCCILSGLLPPLMLIRFT